MRTLKRVRANLIRLRKTKGYTQERLAFESDVAKGFLCEFEKGKKGISLITLEKLADTLEIDIVEFFKKL